MYTNTFYPMGGIPCKVVEYDVGKKRFDKDFKAIQKLVDDMENIYNLNRPEGELAKLNADVKAGTWYPLSSELYGGVESALRWYGKTDGAFDVSVLPIIKLWEDATHRQKPPTGPEIASVLAKAGSQFITISPDKGISFGRDNMQLDFGGIAKGIILDKISVFLQDRAVSQFTVSCGGDVVMKGAKTFKVGINEPEEKSTKTMMVLNIPESAIVTSGHYKRFVEIDKTKYSHIVDPRSAKPVDNGLISVTVIGQNTGDSDALATAITVMGLEKSIDFLKKNDNFKVVLLVKKEGRPEIHYSKELSGKIRYLKNWEKIPRFEF